MSFPEDSPAGRKTFLERNVYRRRRLLDAIKLLPVLGAMLFILPALVHSARGGSTALWLVFFFFSWVILIALCAVLTRRLPEPQDD